MKWRVIFDDDTRWEWEEVHALPDGRTKPVSIDDVDRSKVSHLQTLDNAGKLVHTVTFTKQERQSRRLVWRRHAAWNSQSGTVELGALTGYNRLNLDGTTDLLLDFVALDGTLWSGHGFGVDLHPGEVFSDLEAEKIRSEQEEQNRLTEEDNALLASPAPEPLPEEQREPEPVADDHGDV